MTISALEKRLQHHMKDVLRRVGLPTWGAFPPLDPGMTGPDRAGEHPVAGMPEPFRYWTVLWDGGPAVVVEHASRAGHPERWLVTLTASRLLEPGDGVSSAPEPASPPA